MIKFRLGCLIFFISQMIFAQITVFGYLKDQGGKPVSLATISLGEDRGSQAKSDNVGYFQFKDVSPGTYQVIVNKTGYVPNSFTITVSPGELKKDLGDVKVEYNPSQVEVGMITLSDDDLSTDEGSTIGQTGVGLLQSSRDAFSRTAAFELGAYWFRPRGTDNRYSNIMFNGVPMSKNDTGRPDFGNWGGLNDVIRYPYESVEGNSVSDYSFSDLGGTTYYDTRASSYRKGLSLSYSFTNRTYQNRVMATYSTGMLPSGWAITVSGSRRWMEEGVIDGTYNDSYAYFASVEKRLSDRQRLSFTALGAPSRRAGGSPNTQLVYDLRGKNYNAYWGWQDGEKRSERVRKTFEPIFMLTHYWDINNKTKLTTTASYQTGYDKGSRLNRYEADNPSPTYYKNLPNYWASIGNSFEASALLSDWQNNDTDVTQINWGSLYNANKSAPFYKDPYSGQEGRRASYFLVDDVNKDNLFNAATHLQTRFADNWKFFANLNYQNLVSDNYREVNDLLGSDFVINKSSFIQGDGSATSKDDYNILKPGSVARKGDKTEYYYKLYRQAINANFTTRITLNRWDVAVSANIGWNESYRDGQFMHGLYPDNSYGKSNKENFIELGLRGGVIYKINGRNFITANSAYYESSPTLNEIFANPRLNNDITPNISTQKINANDISYVLKTPAVKGRITGYYTRIKDATEISRYYAQGVGLDGGADAFISAVLTGVQQDYLGGELGLEWKISPTLTATGVAAVGQYTYSNNPSHLYVLSDVSPGLHDYGTAYLKDYKLAGSPQKAYSLGLRYSSPKYWWAGVSGNFLQDIYTDVAALSRTMTFVLDNVNNPVSYYPDMTSGDVRKALKQQQYQDVFMLNASAGKTFRFGKYTMGLSVSVNNILNERGYVSTSFEQGRYANYPQLAADEALQYPLFGDKLFYDRGRSYFMSVNFRF